MTEAGEGEVDYGRTRFRLKYFFFPKNNHWLKRITLVFSFVLFDYIVTLVLCHTSHEEANVYVRVFMESLGIPLGLTLFVLMANLPIYMSLSLDSHIVRLPYRIGAIAESSVDVAFAWFVAGLHFAGATSWFWQAPGLMRQLLGSFFYLFMAFLIVKPHSPHYDY